MRPAEPSESLEARLRAELDLLADGVGTHPAAAPTGRVVDGALRRGHRARRHRRLAGSGAALAVTAFALVIGLGATDPLVRGRDDRPADGTVETGDDPVTTRVLAWADALPTEALPDLPLRPQTPELTSGYVDWLGERVTLPPPPPGLSDQAAAVARTGRGLLLLRVAEDGLETDPHEAAHLGWLSAEGRWTAVESDVTLVGVPAVGRDGLYTYALHRDPAKPELELVTRRVDHTVLGRLTVDQSSRVLGRVGNGTVVGDLSYGAQMWVDGSDRLSPLEEVERGTLRALENGVGLVVTQRSPGCISPLTTVRAMSWTADGALPMWEGCTSAGLAGRTNAGVGVLSPDGQYVVGGDAWFAPVNVWTGEPAVARPTPDTRGWTVQPTIAWEQDGRHVRTTFTARTGNNEVRQVTVRCSLLNPGCTRIP